MTLYELVAKISLDTSEYDKGLDSSSKKMSSFGQSLKGGFSKAAKVGAAAVIGVGTAAVATGVAITKATGKVAEYGDNIDKMSQKMGMSAKTYQEWDHVLQHNGTSIETMKAGMKTLANAAEKGNKSFERIGLTQEQIANMSQEELFEATISGLQGVEDTTERTYLAGQLLGRGATELGALLNMSAEETQAMRDRVNELGGVMSDDAVKASAKYKDTLLDLQTAMQGMTRNIAGQFLPSFTSIMEGLTDIISGKGGGGKKITEGINGIITTIQSSAPKFARVVTTIAKSIGSAISENLPEITSSVINGAMSMASGIMSAAPQLLSASGNILTTIATTVSEKMPEFVALAQETLGQIGDALVTGIPTFLENILPMITSLTEVIRESAGQFIDIGLDFILKMAQGLINGLPTLIAYIPQIIINIAGIINDNAPKLLVTGVKLLAMLAKGIVTAIPALIANFPKILEAIVSVIFAFNWINLGSSIITFIKEGVASLATAIPEAFKSIGETAMEWFGAMNWSTLGADIIDLIVIGIQGLASLIPSALRTIGSTAVNLFKSVPWASVGKAVLSLLSTGMSGAAGLIKNVITKMVNTVKTKIKTGFNQAKTAAINAFNAIKTGITNKINAARDAVQKVVDKIKGFFPISVGKIFSGWIPKIKLTTKKSGDSASTSSSVSRQNFAKAMDNPYMFKRPTEFYAGDAGDEMLYGKTALMRDITSAVEKGGNGNQVYITNYITVENADDPEEFARDFIRRLEMDMRTA